MLTDPEGAAQSGSMGVGAYAAPKHFGNSGEPTIQSSPLSGQLDD
jgi:hypothetical protein